jgi:dephospho-CoA kinase
MAFTHAVALTGSIATGKSTVAKMLSQAGFDIIDADTIAHTILNEQKDAIAQLFGTDVVINDEVNRKALGAIVFADEGKRKMLESLLHPLIYTRIASIAEILDKEKKIYFVDIPLFFEGKRYPIEKVLLVYTLKEIQLKRLMARDKTQQHEAQQRIDTQIDIEEKVKYASYVIDNSGTLLQLKQETLRIVEEIKKDFK